MKKVDKEVDCLVVGSGVSGLHAALPLVEAGFAVTMLDVGFDDSAALESGEARTFEEVRRYDSGQDKIFLGEDGSAARALTGEGGHAAAMASGRRGFVSRGTEQLLPVSVAGGSLLQSLARGGFSEAWGGVCSFYTKEECEVAGLPADEIARYYQEIADIIGVSGCSDTYELQPPADIDANSTRMFEKYKSRKSIFDSLGLELKQPALALLTEPKDGREPTHYRDMDFWDNLGRNVYRGHYTLEKLLGHKNFTYVPGRLAQFFTSVSGGVEVRVHTVDSGEEEVWTAKTLILAAGAINTARIVLRSTNKYDMPTPFMIKTNYMIPCLSLGALLTAPNARKNSLCQLVMEEVGDSTFLEGAYLQFYSYASLLLMKVLPFVPLPTPLALELLSFLVPAMTLADVRFPTPDNETTVTLRKHDESDYLDFASTSTTSHARALSQCRKVLRKLGLMPLRTVQNKAGATHYAGGATVDTSGLLEGEERVFVADSAGWKSLPSKAPAFTLMANARRIASEVQDMLSRGEL